MGKIIFDDILYSLQKSGGGSIYWNEISKNTGFEEEHIIYDNAVNNSIYKGTGRTDKMISSGFLAVKRYFNPRLKKYNGNENFLFHSSYYRFCRNKKAINITTVHDFTFEKYFNKIIAIPHRIQKKRAVMHSKGVICVSENTKKDLMEYYPKYKGTVRVINNGFDNENYYYEEREKTKSIVFVGARTPYKRFDLAIDIVRQMKEYELIVVGGGELTKSEKDLLERSIPGRYRKLKFVTPDELRAIYNEAFFLCYPSEYEGFGIPVIEAQACGCPVVCQNTSSIPDVSGGIAVFITPAEIQAGNINSILRLNDEKYYRDIQNQGIENSRKYSWEQCRKETRAFYNEMMRDI